MNLNKVIIISVTYEGKEQHTHTQRQGEKHGVAEGKRAEL